MTTFSLTTELYGIYELTTPFAVNHKLTTMCCCHGIGAHYLFPNLQIPILKDLVKLGC